MQPRPNILLITTDQQRTDTLSCYGSTFTHTPHIDRLAREGVCFERAYCVNPVCSPSRATIFTGKQVSRHGVFNVGVNLPEDERLISHHLKTVGYRTHYIGKAHFQAFGTQASWESSNGWEKRLETFPMPYYGFDRVELAFAHGMSGMTGHYGQWVKSQVGEDEFTKLRARTRQPGEPFPSAAFDWDIPVRLHNSVWTADRTLEFLRSHDRSQPFLLAIGFEDPHHPHAVPTEFIDRVKPEDVPLPDFVAGELDDKPPFFLEAHHGRLKGSRFEGRFKIAGQGGHDSRKICEHDVRLGRAYYHTLVKLIDQQMGRILAGLDQAGLAENTIVIFTTDHGELLGDHGLWQKGPFLYEPLVRVPMLLRWPARVPGGRRCHAMFSHVDLVPTLLAAAGMSAPEPLDGISALPLLEGTEESYRQHVLIECIDDPQRLRSKCIVTSTRKLVWYCGYEFGELYDLENDPHERVNCWTDPKYAAEKAELLSKLLAEMERLEKRLPRGSYA